MQKKHKFIKFSKIFKIISSFYSFFAMHHFLYQTAINLLLAIQTFSVIHFFAKKKNSNLKKLIKLNCKNCILFQFFIRGLPEALGHPKHGYPDGVLYKFWKSAFLYKIVLKLNSKNILCYAFFG
jgi:hypothetical protein